MERQTSKTQVGKIAITRLTLEHGELQEVKLFKKVNTITEALAEYMLLIKKWMLIRQAEQVNVLAQYDKHSDRLSVNVCGVTYIYYAEPLIEQ